jgi:hypothetical protein
MKVDRAMMDPDSVQSRRDLISFLNQLKADFEANGPSWENKSLPDFLEALAMWAEDMDGYYLNAGLSAEVDLTKQTVKWRVFADLLMAARIYE